MNSRGGTQRSVLRTAKLHRVTSSVPENRVVRGNEKKNGDPRAKTVLSLFKIFYASYDDDTNNYRYWPSSVHNVYERKRRAADGAAKTTAEARNRAAQLHLR